MLKLLRNLLLPALLLLGAAFFLRWENTPVALRVVEALLRPVFHKKMINHYAGVYKEDPLFVTALIKVESNFFRKARSSKGARGLMQLMPKTAQEVAQELKMKGFRESDLEDPDVNLQFGFHYLSKLRKELGDDDVTVLAAYNGGLKNVRDWLKEKRKSRLALSDIEFRETRNFVDEVLSTYHWLKSLQGWRRRWIQSR